MIRTEELRCKHQRDAFIVEHPELIRFLKAIRTDEDLKAKLKVAAEHEALAIAEIAKAAGYDVTAEQFMGHNQWWEDLPF